MGKTVKVLLLEDVASLGRAGDVVDVSEGYARNALFTEGKAALATSDVQQKHNEKQAKREKEALERLQELQAVAEKFHGTELALTARVKEGNEIYGSISPKQVTEHLNKQTSLTLKPRDISLKKPIKQTGTYPVTVQLAREVEFTIHVVVVAGESDNTDDDEE